MSGRLMARDTVEIDTPAARATSCRLAIALLRFRGFSTPWATGS
jgi:hypothetical protein